MKLKELVADMLIALAMLSTSACADESSLNTSWDGALYGYAAHTALRNDAVLNPGNRVAHLPQDGGTLEARFNFKAENDALRLTLRPIVLAQRSDQGRQNEAYLSLWQARLRTTETVSVAAGRDLLNWGPAQFRSPSSPFYFDNGKANPMRELSGLDALKLSWNPDLQHTVTLAHITGSGHVAHDVWRNAWLLKTDLRGADWAGGLALEQTPGQGLFAGLHGQQNASDALLLYAEAASSTQADALQSPADPTLPFSVVARSPRRETVLAGAAYTLDNGQSLYAEFLHAGHGYTADEQRAYFTRAAASLPAAGMALSYAPPLLGRDYLHLVWQSNLMESGGYWRLMATHSVTDGGNEFACYAETALNGRLSAFVLAGLPTGSARQEFSSLLRTTASIGLKVALP